MSYNPDDNDRKLRAVRQAKKVFISLLISGLLLGVIVSVGIVKLMDYLGLTDQRNQTEIIKEKIDQNLTD